MFSRTHFKRLAGTTVALVLLTGLLTGTAVAKPPEYSGDAPPTPGFVTHGGQVMFGVTWTNESGANLPTVSMTAETPNGAEFLTLLDGSPSQGECSWNASLLTCAFGTVNAGASVSFDAVYRVPSSGSSFSVDFVFTAQGSTQNDNPKKSRGDDMPLTGTVALAAAGSDDGGSFIYGDVTTVENNQNLNKNQNPQSAKLDFSGSGRSEFGATVSEAAANQFDCPAGITTCFGHWNVISAANGDQFTDGFEVILGYWQVPGNSANAKFVHLLNPNAANPQEGIDFELITDACEYDPGATTPNNMPCIADYTKVSGNHFYTLVVDDNGPMRGY